MRTSPCWSLVESLSPSGQSFTICCIAARKKRKSAKSKINNAKSIPGQRLRSPRWKNCNGYSVWMTWVWCALLYLFLGLLSLSLCLSLRDEVLVLRPQTIISEAEKNEKWSVMSAFDMQRSLSLCLPVTLCLTPRHARNGSRCLLMSATRSKKGQKVGLAPLTLFQRIDVKSGPWFSKAWESPCCPGLVWKFCEASGATWKPSAPTDSLLFLL